MASDELLRDKFPGVFKCQRCGKVFSRPFYSRTFCGCGAQHDYCPSCGYVVGYCELEDEYGAR